MSTNVSTPRRSMATAVGGPVSTLMLIVLFGPPAIQYLNSGGPTLFYAVAIIPAGLITIGILLLAYRARPTVAWLLVFSLVLILAFTAAAGSLASELATPAP